MSQEDATTTRGLLQAIERGNQTFRGGLTSSNFAAGSVHDRLSKALLWLWRSYYTVWQFMDTYCINPSNENSVGGRAGVVLTVALCHLLSLFYGLAVHATVPPLLFANKWVSDVSSGIIFLPAPTKVKEQ